GDRLFEGLLGQREGGHHAPFRRASARHHSATICRSIRVAEHPPPPRHSDEGQTMSEVTRGPGRELAVIAGAQVLALTTWFAASAAAPAIKAEWHLSGAEVPLLTTAVQVGFVLGALTSAFVNV